MDTFSYRVFLTIAEHKSFQKAAEIYNVTPPAISHTIKQLEKDFGFSLFIRNRQGITLTNAGETLLAPISDIVKKEENLFQTVAEINGLDSGEVRIGIFSSMSKVIPRVIRDFNIKYPQIEFEIFQGAYEDIIEWLKNGMIDIGFLSKTVNPDFPFFEIMSDPLMCILPEDFLTEDDRIIRLETIAGTPYVMQREYCDADAKRILDEMHNQVKSVCHVTDDKSTVDMVKNGFGFAIMPLLAMNGLENGVKMLEIFPRETRIIGAAVRNERELTPAVRKVLDFIKNYKYS